MTLISCHRMLIRIQKASDEVNYSLPPDKKSLLSCSVCLTSFFFIFIIKCQFSDQQFNWLIPFFILKSVKYLVLVCSFTVEKQVYLKYILNCKKNGNNNGIKIINSQTRLPKIHNKSCGILRTRLRHFNNASRTVIQTKAIIKATLSGKKSIKIINFI